MIEHLNFESLLKSFIYSFILFVDINITVTAGVEPTAECGARARFLRVVGGDGEAAGARVHDAAVHGSPGRRAADDPRRQLAAPRRTLSRRHSTHTAAADQLFRRWSRRRHWQCCRF